MRVPRCQLEDRLWSPLTWPLPIVNAPTVPRATPAPHARATRRSLDRYDRPLHRRRHQHDIDAAHRTLSDQSEILHHARRQLADTSAAPAQLDADAASAADTLTRRPELRARVADIDHDLTADRHARTRIARLEQPDTITNTLGPRPHPVPPPTTGTSPPATSTNTTPPSTPTTASAPTPHLEHSAYATSREMLDPLIEPIHRHPPIPTINPPTIELGL